ncbi:MAG: hypothetical protein R2865_14085 [Deinococcales bacterium]
MSYNLVAYSPWGGHESGDYGDRGRIELEVIENVEHLKEDKDRDVSASKSGLNRPV